MIVVIVLTVIIVMIVIDIVGIKCTHETATST